MRRVAIGFLLLGLTACAAYPGAPALGLQRSLFPGLGDAEPEEIESLLAREIELSGPVSAGVAWLSDGQALSEYGRTGVLESLTTSLRQAPFGTVGALPTIALSANPAPDERPLDQIRSASAHFQYDVALLLQTGTADDRGLNPFALGYLGLVTAPLFPGTNLATSSSAELCAIDVRTGVMLGCARGRAEAMDRMLFLWQVERAKQRMTESTLRAAVAAAADDLRAQLAARIATR